jgi:hypothetical protein
MRPSTVSALPRRRLELVGLSAQEARQTARSLVTLGEEEIGILARKSPREIGFFHGIGHARAKEAYFTQHRIVLFREFHQ